MLGLVEEIAAELDYRSLATVHDHVTKLVRKGYLRQTYNQPRSLQVLTEEQANSGGPPPVSDAVYARALLELVHPGAADSVIQAEAVHVARELLGPVPASLPVANLSRLGLVRAARERLGQRRTAIRGATAIPGRQHQRTNTISCPSRAVL